MELNKLRHFSVAADCKSLSAAAEKVGVGVPALSRSIKRLEESIGDNLFERTRQGLKLTVLGQVLLEYANNILREHDRALFAIDAVTKQQSGSLRIGVVRYLSNFGLAEAITSLLERFPKIGIEVIDSTYEELLLKLLDAEIDVAIAILTTPLTHKELTFEPVVKSDLIVAAASSHPLAQKKEVTRDDLQKTRRIISNRPAHIRIYYQNLKAKEAQVDHHPIIVSSPALARNLLYQGNLTAICSRHDVAADLKSGRIVELNYKVPNTSLPIGFIRREGDVQSGVLAAFLQEGRRALVNAASKEY